MNRMRQILRVPLEHVFGATFIAYFGLLLVYLYFNAPQPHRDYLATRDLAPNHRIVASDVKRPQSFGFYMPPFAAVEGRYLKQSIKRGERISTTSLGDRPSMQFSDNFRAIAFPRQTGSIPVDLIDVGSPVILFGRDPDAKCPINVAATVHAIVCDPKKTGEAANCYPILRVPADKSLVVAKNQSGLHLALLPQPQP
jgi:hypothetical protein